MKKLLIIALIAMGSISFAGECVLHVIREACPGQETESYKKCEGKKECDENKSADSEKACMKEALKACENARLEITKSKLITAVFDKKPVEGGKQFCAADRPDFNKCKK
jgi:hypothetical protein